ncbi:MAG TPA: NUDIX domain-containing protein [Candidatus Paceibacterota bacterium]|nr:NUDIX domain-containing protein [Candidatus Paceibacterota bacterium]
MKNFRYRKGVFVVVYRFEKKKKLEYLILKRKLHWKGWEFTKGGVENGENLVEAVKREIKEECGLKTLKIKKYNLKGKFRYDKKTLEDRQYIGQSYNLFSAQVKNKIKKVKIDKREHSDYKWVDYNTAIKILTWENQRKALRLVNDFLSV